MSMSPCLIYRAMEVSHSGQKISTYYLPTYGSFNVGPFFICMVDLSKWDRNPLLAERSTRIRQHFRYPYPNSGVRTTSNPVELSFQ